MVLSSFPFRSSFLVAYTSLQLFFFTGSSQAPGSMPYQAVLRDANGAPLQNTAVSMRFTITNNSENGEEIWQENNTTTTNGLGLINVNLGQTQSLLNVDWSNGSKFLRVERNIEGNYILIGTQPLMSVPYTLYANEIPLRVSATGDTLIIGSERIIIPGISVANAQSLFSDQHSCGISGVHNASLNYGSLIDQDGNTYKTIIIGNQEWMAENLNTAKYRNGETISTNLSSAMWQSTNSGAYVYYDQTAANECPHGKLYNYYAVADSRQLCPTGWHVPLESDWLLLENFLGGALNAGGKMKSTSQWFGANVGATNESGFSSLPSGRRYFYADFGDLTFTGIYWSRTAFDTSNAWVRFTSFSEANLWSSIFPMGSGHSVRCVKD